MTNWPPAPWVIERNTGGRCSRLEELRGAAPAFALGAKGGPLLERIRRLAQLALTPRLTAGGVLGIVLVVTLVAAGIIWSAGASTTESASPVPEEPVGSELTTAEWQEHVVTIHGENVTFMSEDGIPHRVHGPNKYFPAVVMESDGQTSYLLTTSWGAKDFWLGQLPSGPVSRFTIAGTETVARVVAYDMTTGVAVFSVEAALTPVPRDAIGGDVEVGDRLIELQLPGKKDSGEHAVLAVERTASDEDSNGASVEVPHLVVLDGSPENTPGSLLLRDGKLLALFLNNFPFEERRYAPHAIPISVALREYAKIRSLPFIVRGRVTDDNQQPLPGVEVVAHAGMGTLRRTGTATTGEDGTYMLWFGPGMRTQRSESAPLSVGVQAATISPRLDGWYEVDLHQLGNLAIADHPLSDEERKVLGRLQRHHSTGNAVRAELRAGAGGDNRGPVR